MGSVGQFRQVSSLNPNKTQVPKSKLKNYLLNPSKDVNKAKYFKSLGYNMQNHNRLIQDIKEQLTSNTSTTLHSETNEYGDSMYHVFMYIGIDKKDLVKTVWILRKGTDTPQLVTAYPASEKERREYGKD